MLQLLTGLLPVAEKVLDRVIPDPKAKQRALQELAKLEQEGELAKIEAEFADLDSARKREVEILKTGSKDWMMNVTGMIGLGSFVFLIYAIVFITVPEHNSELMIHTTGIVEGIVLSIVGYYFGSIAKNK